MMAKSKPAFLCHFDDLEDPRIDRKKLYPLSEILFVVLCGCICGTQSWRDFVIFGEEKLDCCATIIFAGWRQLRLPVS